MFNDRGFDDTIVLEKSKYSSRWHKVNSLILENSSSIFIATDRMSLHSNETNDVSFVVDCDLYNWKELNERHELDTGSGPELLKQFTELAFSRTDNNIDIRSVMQSLDGLLAEIRGVYSFALYHDNRVYLARDMIGVKPLWYNNSNGLAFASEKKFLYGFGYDHVRELGPRNMICYDLDNGTVTTYDRDLIAPIPEHRFPAKKLNHDISELLQDAISVRIPDEDFGILFSGGIDSTIISRICQQICDKGNTRVTCYTVGLQQEQTSPDVHYAMKVADEFGIPLKICEIGLEEIENYLKVVVPLIEEPSVPKVGVALTMYAASMAAARDGIKFLFSGAGADELFAGYDRYKRSDDVNNDCYRDILEMHEKNTYRDDVVASATGTVIRFPYLDQALVEYALRVPAEHKINNEQNKLVLRTIGEELGISHTITQRNKQAAQYGSRFDKAIRKLTKKKGYRYKTEYLESLCNTSKPKLGVLFSSGKDCHYAMHLMQQRGYPIECLITLKSMNPDSYMFHTPNIDLAQLQAYAMDMPLIEWMTEGEKEVELADLRSAIKQAIRDFDIKGIVTGALYSNYQKSRIEHICEELGIGAFSPLWHMDQEKEMHDLLDIGFEFIFSSIAAYGLNSSWVGHTITSDDIDRLVRLNGKIGVNVAGEGGEFESFVVDGPMYKKRIIINKYDVIELDEYTARLTIEDAELTDK
ncbi:MAG: diphthine--ammonia ligase [Methanosarcinaceae archaeon]